MNMAEWLERVANTHGGSPALFHGLTCVADYTAFRNRAASLGHRLRQLGIATGDRIAIFARNSPDYLVALYGIWYAGAVAVPINAKLHAREAAWILQDAGAKRVFVTDAANGAALQSFDVSCTFLGQTDFTEWTEGTGSPPVSRSGSDLAWLFYTSGTTGRPKGVQITHAMLAATSLCYPIDVDPVYPTDGAYYAAPMSHGAGLYAPIHVRMAARHIVPASGGFDPQDILAAGRSQGPLSMFMAPTMVQRLVDEAQRTGADGTGLRTIVYGGGPMYLADIERAVSVLGPRLVQIYGQGECPMAISALGQGDVADRSHPDWRARLTSVGRAQSAVEVAIVDSEGHPVPNGVLGEIVVRGAPVMPGYWNNPHATQKAVRNGWLMTGDIGSLDDAGYLTLQDRSKDVIISGGTNIYPREVEDAILCHDDVIECAVVGRPSTIWGEDVVAFVVLRRDAREDEIALDTICLEQIARFKRPKAYYFVESLPKNNYGKVLKTDLRDTLAQ